MNLKLLKICIVFCLLQDISGLEDEIETSCNINGKKALQYVSDKFLSFTIDPAVLLAGVSLSENSLRLAKHLSPGFIRIAGPSTPFVKYFDKDDRLPSYLSEDGNNVVVSPSMWFGINEWLKLAHLVPVFGLNDADTARGVWNPKATLPLLEISDKLNVSCYWQLGYDSSNKSETRYTQDLNILDYILAAFPEKNETWKIVGSDISHIPSEKTDATIDEVGDIISAVMWEPSDVKDVLFAEKDMPVKLLQKSSRSNIKLWTTAPKSDGPVTFSSALLWAKQLGNAAKLGYDVVFRQPRIHELFSDTPVYWLSLLHKKLMGNNVLDAKTIISHEGTNIYAHCTRKQNSFVRRGAMTVMIVNDNSGEYKVKVKLGMTLPEKSMEIQTYLLTSQGLNSTVVSLNGQPLSQDILQNNFPFEPKIRRSKAPTHILLTVPPYSVGFFVLPSAQLPVCIEEEKEIELLLEEMEINQNMPLSEEILKLESRSFFGGNHALEELARKMKQEMKLDQQYYNSFPLVSRSDHVKEEEKIDQGKIDDRGRRKFIDRVKLSERQKKHLDFEKKREELRKFLLDKAKSSKQEAKVGTRTKHIELTSAEAERILKDRAKQRAARRNIVFTDEELDALIQRASKKSYKRKFKRSVRPKQKRYINMQLLERTMHFDPIAEKRSSIVDNDNSENINMKRSARKPTEASIQWDSKKQELLSNTETTKENIKDSIRELKNSKRFRRGLDMDSKLSEYKIKLAERSRKWDEKKDELLGNAEAMRDNVKEKLQDLRNRRRFTRDLSRYKVKLAERSKKWDEKKNEILGNTEARREHVKEKLRGLRNNKRARRDLDLQSRIAQYETRLAESRRKWEEKRKELVGNTETVRKNLEERLEELRNKRRFTRELSVAPKSLLGNTDIAEENIEGKLGGTETLMRFGRDINMDLLDTNTRGQKKSGKLAKSTIKSKKLKDAEATIRQPGQTSSEFVEDNSEMIEESKEHTPTNQEIYAELADSEDLEEEELFNTTPKSRKLSFFDKKSKLDPFAIAHPTIDVVEPTFMKSKKGKKKKAKTEDDLQFLTASEEFTDIEDDLPCIHEYFGPDSSVEDKKTKKLMQELGEIFEDEKVKSVKKSKKKKMVSEEDLMRKRRALRVELGEEPSEKLNTNIENPVLGDVIVSKQEEHFNNPHVSEDSNHSGSNQHLESPSDAELVETVEETTTKVHSIDPTSQKEYLLEKSRKKREHKKTTSVGTLDFEENFNNYKKEMKKHLKDLKNLLDDDKLKFEEKKQKNKLKLLQLKKKQELDLANAANDKLTKIHNEENEHGNQILEQLENLKKELQLRKDRIDQALEKARNEDDAVGQKKPRWNEIRFSTKQASNDLNRVLEGKSYKSRPKEVSSRIQDAEGKPIQPTTSATTETAVIEPTVTVVKRSIFDARRNILGPYQPMSLDLPMWKPSDVLSLQKDLNSFGVSPLSPPNDLYIFQNLLGQNRLLRKRQSIDSSVDDIDNFIDDDVDDSLNAIKKDIVYFPEGMKTTREEDYKLVLPNKDTFEITETDGDTEIKFDHRETMRGKPKDMTDGPSFNFFGGDSIPGGRAGSEDKGGSVGQHSGWQSETTTETVGGEDATRKTPRSVDNIQKIASKEEAKILESFINNFSLFLSDIGKHIKDYVKFMTDNN